MTGVVSIVINLEIIVLAEFMLSIPIIICLRWLYTSFNPF